MRTRFALTGITLAILLAGPAPSAMAQQPDEAQIARGQAVWKKSDCGSCHGWAGHGAETEPVPPGPSLRATQLDLASILETAQCGRPGTGMPSHDRLAYTDKRCYGLTSQEIGKDRPPPGNPLQPAELADVAAYVFGYLKGRGPVTKAECEQYNTPGSPACLYYK